MSNDVVLFPLSLPSYFFSSSSSSSSSIGDRLPEFPAKTMAVNDSIESRLIFHEEDDPLRFRIGEPGPKSRELASVFGGDRRFELRRNFCEDRNNHVDTRGSDGDDMDDEDDETEVRKRDALIEPGVDSGDNCSSAAEAGTGKHGSVGRELVVREDEAGKSWIDRDEVHTKVTIAAPHGNAYESQYNTQATGGFVSVKKDIATNVGSWESLRAILSDPVTGALMEDAMILPCGHSFGGGGIEKVKRLKACCTCSQPVSEGSIKPNLSLRVVVHAFRHEEEGSHFPKRRKERSDQDKRTFCIPTMVETPKSRGIQFPFSIGDRVIIMGNKRTPPRFVGRKAVIMTHCLNGWYVVKTLDNAESIKLQHCSLAKIADDPFAKVTVAEMAPAWL